VAGIAHVSRLPRKYGNYWNPAKEWEPETIEEIADVLDDFRPPDFMPVDLAAQLPQSPVIDANELLWAARILAALVRVHRNVIPDMRGRVNERRRSGWRHLRRNSQTKPWGTSGPRPRVPSRRST